MSDNVIIPPLNFSIIARGVYRSGYPNKRNHAFLKKLKLKSILYLCPEAYSEDNTEFIEKSGIRLLHFGINGNKEPFVDMPVDVIRQALREMLDVRNQPLLIHCVPADHEILTEHGWMDLDAYKRAAAGGDVRVAGFDVDAEQIVFETPNCLVEQAPRRQSMVLLESNEHAWAGDSASPLSFAVTRGHDLFVADKSGGAFRKIKASELLDGYSAGAFRQRACASGGVRAPHAAAALQPVRELLQLDTDARVESFLELYGAWLGDGSVTRSGADGARAVQVAFGRGAADALRALALDSVQLAASGRACVDEPRWVAFFGGLATSAFAPWAWSLNRDQLRCIVRGVRRASGGAEADESSAWTQSASFRDELMRVLLLAGYAPRFERVRDAWQVCWWTAAMASAAQPALEAKRGEVRAMEYDGRVWCFNMPSGFIWVRRVERSAESGGAVTRASRAVLTGNCNKGKHRTGCVVGCLRKLQHWSQTSAFDEYRRFAGSKARVLDMQFIELFDPESVEVDEEHKPSWL
jgi:protein tyrosine/serine phosphatase